MKRCLVHHKRGAVEWKDFLNPWNKEMPDQCFASRVKKYMDLMEITLHSRILFTVFTKGRKTGTLLRWSVQRLSLESRRKLPFFLVFQNQKLAHGFRRALATEAADKGATTIDMKRKYGWRSEDTPCAIPEPQRRTPQKMAKLVANDSSKSSSSNSAAALGPSIFAATTPTRRSAA